MARDATARQYDVDADGVQLDVKKGEITFRAKKGRLVDLESNVLGFREMYLSQPPLHR